MIRRYSLLSNLFGHKRPVADQLSMLNLGNESDISWTSTSIDRRAVTVFKLQVYERFTADLKDPAAVSSPKAV